MCGDASIGRAQARRYTPNGDDVKIAFIYPNFERHADSHPELKEFVPANEYLGPPSMGIANVAATTPDGHEIAYFDDRVEAFDCDTEADVYALSFFTPAATRGMELCDELLKRGKTVVAGGIFPSMMPDEVAPHVSSLVIGEGEPVWAQLLEDIEKGQLKPRYHGEGGELGTYPPPRLDLYLGAEREGHHPDDYPLQLSRGCPMQCDACVLPIHLGRKMRFQSDENLIYTMKVLTEAGKLISFTEDTSVTFAYGARRKFRTFLELCLELQQGGLPLRFSYLGISMPMILHLDDDLFNLLAKTGIDRFYLVGGFDTITRQAFGTGDMKAMDKAERAIARCQEKNIDPYVSFLMGNPDDDDKVFQRMVDFARRTGIDLAEFCVSTPYPNTPIWHRLIGEDRIFDFTWKHYNDSNVVFQPHHMSAEALRDGYLYTWREFYGGRRADLTEREHQRKTIQF